MSDKKAHSRTMFAPVRIKFISILLLIFFYGCSESKDRDNERNPATKSDTVAPTTQKEIENPPFDSSLSIALSKLIDESNFSGVVTIMGKDGKKYTSSYGYSNFEKEIKNDESSIFQLASLTKIFTAAAIYDLEKKGKLKFSDHFTKHLKSALPYKTVQIKHLLNHTSGIPDYFTLAEKNYKGAGGPDNKQIFGLYNSNPVPLNFEPGKSYEYSNINYIILSSIVADVSGVSFEKYLRESISAPFFPASVFAREELLDSTKQVAIAYSSVGTKYSRIPPGATRLLEKRKGSGGLHISASDLNAWLTNLFFTNDFYTKVIKDAELKKKLGSKNYILGWYTGSLERAEYLYCYGKNPGMNSYCAYIPSLEIIVTILSNNEINSQKTGDKFVSTIISESKR